MEDKKFLNLTGGVPTKILEWNDVNYEINLLKVSILRSLYGRWERM